MKKLILMSFFLFGFSVIVLAQGPRRTPSESAEQLKKSLKLDDEQVAKVKVIYEHQAKVMDSLRVSAKGDMGSMRGKMRPLMTETNSKIKSILTPEQAATFQKNQEEMMKNRGARSRQN